MTAQHANFTGRTMHRRRAASPRPPGRLVRRRGVWVGALASALTLCSLTVMSVRGRAEPTVEGEREDPSVAALRRAIDQRMTVWRAADHVVYVRHCRAARGGCPERVAAFARLIGAASRRHRLDPFLLAAVAMRESGMDPLAAGAAGERGIVQLHPQGSGARLRFVRSEAYRRHCERRSDACQDEVLEIGARLLARTIANCGSVREGLGAYNRGECGVTTYAEHVMNERQVLLRLAKGDNAVASIQ